MIVWGTKVNRKKLGWVADFCPFCRDIRAFRLIRIGQAGHIYFISFGSGTLVGHRMTCGDCGNVVPTDATQYSSVSEASLGDTQALAQATHPDVYDKYEARLNAEEQLQSGTLSNKDRLELLREPFLQVNDHIEARAAAAHFDIISGLIPLITIALIVVIGALCRSLPALEQRDLGLKIMLAVAAFGFTLTILALATDVGRFVRRKIHPSLLMALQPLNPTQEELSAVLASMRALGFAVGKKVRAERLYEDLTSGRAAGIHT